MNDVVLSTPGGPSVQQPGDNMKIRRVTAGVYRLDLSIWDRHKKRPTHIRRTVNGSRADAFRVAGEIARQTSGSFTAWTLGDAIAHYRKHHATASMASYLDSLENEAADIRIGDRLTDYWDGRLVELRETRAVGTVNKYAAVLRAVLRFSERTKRIPCTPIVNWGIRRAAPRDVVLSQDEVDKLLNTVDREAPHLSAIVRFALAVPCRTGELVSMTVDHLDMVNNRIRLTADRNKGGIGAWKPIPPGWLQEYFRALPKATYWLFFRVSEMGAYVPLGDFKRAWNRCLRLSGLKGRLRFHDLRHIAATALVNAGTPEQVVMQVAGWRTNMLRNYYHRSEDATNLIRWSEPEPSQNLAPAANVVGGK